MILVYTIKSISDQLTPPTCPIECSVLLWYNRCLGSLVVLYSFNKSSVVQLYNSRTHIITLQYACMNSIWLAIDQPHWGLWLTKSTQRNWGIPLIELNGSHPRTGISLMELCWNRSPAAWPWLESKCQCRLWKVNNRMRKCNALGRPAPERNEHSMPQPYSPNKAWRHSALAL
jgi:hypothetical protein